MVPRLRAEYPPEGYEGVRRSHPTPGAMGGIPLWGILLLVLLGIVAITAVVIALASIALALG